MDIRKKENKMKLNINKIGKSGYAIYFNDEFIDSFCFEANIKLENDTFELLSQTFKNPYTTLIGFADYNIDIYILDKRLPKHKQNEEFFGKELPLEIFEKYFDVSKEHITRFNCMLPPQIFTTVYDLMLEEDIDMLEFTDKQALQLIVETASAVYRKINGLS